MKIRHFILFAIVFLLSGCATDQFSGKRNQSTQDIMAGLIGNDIDNIITDWGTPTSTHNNRDGSRLYIWEERWNNDKTDVYGNVASRTWYTCAKKFLTNEQRIITQWRTDGSCPISDKKISRDIPEPLPTLSF